MRRVAFALAIATLATGCNVFTKPHPRVTFVVPPAERLKCPDEPPPPGKPGEAVTEDQDFAWQQSRDLANGTCRINMRWIDKFMSWLKEHYATTRLDIPTF